MHELQRCGIAVELLRVKEPQDVSRQSGKVARQKSEGRSTKSQPGPTSDDVKKSSLHTSVAAVIVISSDDDFEK
jgi:hypothetical protein